MADKGMVKNGPQNMFPLYYLPWSSFDQYVDNELVSKDKYLALDRASDLFIIDATHNKANETVQIKVFAEKYSLTP